MAHERGVTVEGELGRLGGMEDGHGADVMLWHDQLLTNPVEAVKFVAETRSTRSQ